MISIMEHLEIQKEAITSATRMGKFRPESIRPRTFLVKFRDKMTAYKVLASAFRLKQYDGTADENFKEYIIKSLNKTCNIRPNTTQRRSVEKVPINDWQASVTLILLVFHCLDLAS